jgi:hypothetical protein
LRFSLSPIVFVDCLAGMALVKESDRIWRRPGGPVPDLIRSASRSSV